MTRERPSILLALLRSRDSLHYTLGDVDSSAVRLRLGYLCEGLNNFPRRDIPDGRRTEPSGRSFGDQNISYFYVLVHTYHRRRKGQAESWERWDTDGGGLDDVTLHREMNVVPAAGVRNPRDSGEIQGMASP